MTIRQSRYILAETEQEKKVRVTEIQRAEGDPFIRRSEIQQTVSNSTLPVSSRAVSLIIEDKIESGNLADRQYVDDSIASLNIEQYAKASTLDEKADKYEITNIQETKADKEDLKGLASERYVREQIDAIPEVDLSNYLTKPVAESTYAKKTDLSKKADKTDITELQSSIDKKVDITVFNEEVSKKLEQKDLAGYATEDYVKLEISKIPEIDLAPYAKKIDLNAYLTIEASSGFADKQYVDDAINSIETPSLDGYATESYVDQKFNSIDLSSYASIAYVDDKFNSIDVSKYATKAELTKKWDVQETVGSGKVMREGAFGLGRVGSTNYDYTFPSKISNLSPTQFVGAPPDNSVPLDESGAPASDYAGINISRALRPIEVGVSGRGRSARLWFRANSSPTPSREEYFEACGTNNTTTDSNGVLHAGSSTPIDTLNVSDMADKVVDNDEITVTSGAVYRAIGQLMDQIASLDAKAVAAQKKIDSLEKELATLKDWVKTEVGKATGMRFKG